MQRFVALLRGVNVGKAKRMPMAELREILCSLGFANARTILNSGNAVFDGSARSAKTHAARIHEAILERLNVDAAVIVKTASDFAAVVGENPLLTTETNPSRLLIAFTAEPASLNALASLKSTVEPPDHLHLGKHALYLSCPNGILQSRTAAALLGKEGRAATTRNWGTVLRISQLL